MERRSSAADKERLEARAIGRILDRQTREIVGWVYEWNTGERAHLWKNGEREDVVFEDEVQPCKVGGVGCERAPKRNL
ncbi:hypothetical protein I5535_15865 [Rhodobacteraceae bacterium F11138]|nr:hypothetical protein [Rhodobacteraceae bacterium F11138]